MTDRHAGYIVVLESNLREDDAEPTLNAIRQIRGVAEVTPILGDASTAIAEGRIRHEMSKKFYEFWKELVGIKE